MRFDRLTMRKLSYNDIYPLEHYCEIRDEFRRHVIAHRNRRRLLLGDAVMLLFEDRLLMQYQIQEMLKIENILDPAGIEEELSVYNPLIPDGSNWKATMMIQYPEAEERHQRLQQLRGIEKRVWMQVGDFKPVFAIADEDFARTDRQKTSAVHFLRFELDANQVAAAKSGAPVSAGIDHAHYRTTVRPLPERMRLALLADLA